MKQLILFVTSLSVFALLTACGDGFKSSAFEGSKTPEQVLEEPRGDSGAGSEPTTVEQTIYDLYAAEIEQRGKASNDALFEKLKGFDITVDYIGGDVTASANMMMGESCASSSPRRISRLNIDMDEVKTGRATSLGDDVPEPYEVIVHCTDSACNNMVVALREHGQALILLPLTKINSENITEGVRYDVYGNNGTDAGTKGFYQVANYNDAFAAQIRCEEEEAANADDGNPLDPDDQDTDDFIGPPAPTNDPWIGFLPY